MILIALSKSWLILAAWRCELYLCGSLKGIQLPHNNYFENFRKGDPAMNKRCFFALFAIYMTLLSGCREKAIIETTGETVPQETTSVVTTEQLPPGIALYPEGTGNPLDKEEEMENDIENGTTGSVSENNSAGNTDNAGSNSQNNTNDETDGPKETVPSTGETTQPEIGEEEDSPEALTYEEYNAMGGAEQMAYFNSFANPEDFFLWYNAAKAKYEAEHPDIEIADGSINGGDIAGSGN